MSRADLAHLIDGLAGEDPRRVAELLGFVEREERSERTPGPALEPAFCEPALPRDAAAPGQEPAAPVESRPRFWRVVSHQTLVPEGGTEAPAWYRQAMPIGQRAHRGVPARPEDVPIIIWPCMLGFLRQHLVTLCPFSALDVRRIVRRLAAARPLRALPRRLLRRWPSSTILLLDWHEDAFPLRSDFAGLARRLAPLLGNRLRTVRLKTLPSHSPEGLRAWLADEAISPETALTSRWVVVSDLGARQPGSRRETFWRGLLSWLAGRRAMDSLVLVPAPPATWPGVLARGGLRAARLDRAVLRLTRPDPAGPPAPADDARTEDACLDAGEREVVRRLLAMLAMTPEARPRLLRKLRLLLAPGSHDVSTELLVWNHRDVLRLPPDGVVHPDARGGYQATFLELAARDPRLAEQARRVVEADHANAYPHVLGLDRQYLGAADGRASDAPGAVGDAVKALAQDDSDSEEARMLGQWADSVVRGVADGVFEVSDQLAGLREVVRSIRSRTGDGASGPPDPRFAFLFEHRPLHGYTVWQRGRGMSVATASPPEAPGSPVAVLRSRDGRVSAETWSFWAAGEPPSWASAWGEDHYGPWVAVTIVGGVTVQQRFRWIPAGRFMMGSPVDEPGRRGSETPHEVRLTEGCWLADKACTQALWTAVMGENPSRFDGVRRPVERVSWDDVQVFIRRLNAAVSGLDARLPSEAEWEYACRAGTGTAFSFGESIGSEQVNFRDRTAIGGSDSDRRQTVAVGSLPANSWGLHEMHGNVWEWCSDWYGAYPAGPVDDPAGAADGGQRVLRGGSWISSAGLARSACRVAYQPGVRNVSFGFRLARGQSGAVLGGPRPARPAAAGERAGTAMVPAGKVPDDQARYLPPGARDRLALTSDHERLVLEALARPAWASAMGRDRHGLFASFEVSGVTQRLRWIAPGRFQMGSPIDEPEREAGETWHEVRLTRGYWLAETTCTLALWRAVMGDNPGQFTEEAAGRPVEQVSWTDVQRFIGTLNNTRAGLAARLPTEAEWEHACRAGTETPFSFGASITPDEVNCHGEHPYAGGPPSVYRDATVPVGTLPPNLWGLHEMHGNVREWCADWHGPYSGDSVESPRGPQDGELRVLRGGGWIHYARSARSACRFALPPDERLFGIGFRIARGQ